MDNDVVIASKVCNCLIRLGIVGRPTGNRTTPLLPQSTRCNRPTRLFITRRQISAAPLCIVEQRKVKCLNDGEISPCLWLTRKFCRSRDLVELLPCRKMRLRDTQGKEEEPVSPHDRILGPDPLECPTQSFCLPN